MQSKTLMLIAIVMFNSGCAEDNPKSTENENKEVTVEEPTPLPQSISELQSERSVVGMIEFFPTEAAAEEFPYYSLPEGATFIGLLEMDALCLQADGTLVVFDNEAENRILCKAASSEASFLSALNVLNDFFNKNAVEGTFDEAGAVKVRDRCTEIAGGEEFRTFFVMLLGV